MSTRTKSPVKKAAPTAAPLAAPGTKTTTPQGFWPQQAALVGRLIASYQKDTPQLLRLVDAYLACVMVSGVVQFVYCVLVGTFPYNSFLSGFIASVGAFVLAANLRMQLNPKNEFYALTPEGAFAEFVFCSLVFYGFVVNFLG
ncbi:Dolichyl-diphosphooligosaccharide-protein glycosyltransferase subunit dad1 [Podochytrium sp. JEL0797]|nr:Dolichyl-diphosphooligosaccharide-protein glycosyltransferase subunit dad1 [Podochytrium sp. JEL0797]